jgi:hypothetical protein
MRQEHRFGEKVFIDFAGDTIPVLLSYNWPTYWWGSYTYWWHQNH